MTTLFFLGMTFLAAVCALIAVPLILLKVVLGVTLTALALPFQIVGSIVGGLVRGLAKGAFLLALFLIPLAILALPFTILAFGAWLLFRLLRPRRAPQAYVVS